MTELKCDPKKCGAACCKMMVMEVGNPDRNYRDYYRKKGLEIDEGFLLVPYRCPHLTEDDLCDLHGTDRKPYLCRIFGDLTIKGFYAPKNCVWRKKWLKQRRKAKKLRKG